MSRDPQEITLQSIDSVLVAKNEGGHMTEPILILPEGVDLEDVDWQDFESVLVFVEGKVRDTGGSLLPFSITLNEENNYTEEIIVPVEGDWFAEGNHLGRIQFSVQTNAIIVSKLPTWTTPGTYQHFIVIFSETRVILMRIALVVSVPLAVRHGNTTVHKGGTMTIHLTAPNYSTQYLYITRDRAWSLAGVESTLLNVSPTSGSGAGQWDSEVVSLSKAVSFIPERITTTTFQIVSGTHVVIVIVHLTPPTTGEWIDPLPGEEGVSGKEDVYVYL